MNRLKVLREMHNLNMREVASKLGIPYTTYVNYEKGTREPNSEMLISLANFYSVSIDYLIGRDENCREKTKADSNKKECEHIYEDKTLNYSTEERKLLNKYRALDAHGKSVIDANLDLEYKRIEELRAPKV